MINKVYVLHVYVLSFVFVTEKKLNSNAVNKIETKEVNKTTG